MSNIKQLINRILLCGIVAMACSISATAQISFSIKNKTVREAIREIEKKTEYRFFINDDLPGLNAQITLEIQNQPIKAVMDQISRIGEFSYLIRLGNQIVVSPRTQEQKQTSPKRSVTGVITDDKGEPVIGANVSIKGTTTGTITDIDGNFNLEVSQGQTLVVSYIGYSPKEIAVGNQSAYKISLAEDMQNLEEVVVVGYGTQKKVNLSGSVDVIDSKKLADRQAATVSQLLQGVAPGFNFSIGDQGGFQPGANMKMTIRGMGSLNGGEPYVLIDGFPGDINNLNPEDIESISVLKDASASAIYGARAPYGVILVTTKAGKKNQKISVTYSGNVMVNTPQKLPKMLDSHTWARALNEAGDNMGGHPISNATVDRIVAYQNQDWNYLKGSMPNWPDGANIFGAYPEGNVWNSANLNYANTDWWDVYFGHSVNQKHDLSVNGGTDKISYYFSAGYIDQSGVLNYGTDKFSRYNILGKVNVSLAKWWDFTWETRFAQKYREKPNMTKEGDYSFLYRHISRAYPITPVYNGWGGYTFESHIPSMMAGTDRDDNNDYWNNFKMEIRPLKGWKINADFAYNTTTGKTTEVEKYIMIQNVDQSYSPNGVSIPNNYAKTQSERNYWTANLFSSYDISLNKDHNLGILAGMQMERANYSHLYGYKSDIMVEDVPSLETSTGTAILKESLTHSGTAGFFGRLTYNYKEKYLLESNLRYDGSYVFSRGNRWGLFPSFSLGWNVHKEKFWEPVANYINTFKIRGSWGKLGNQNVNPYTDIELVPISSSQLNWVYNYGSKRPIGYTNAPGIINRNLTWESAATTNIGLDFSLFNNQLQANFDVYERLTTDMIGPAEAKPGVLGADVPQANNSTLRTRGWELSLNWKQTLNNGLSYFVGFNLYDNKSTVTKYYNPTGSLSTWYEGATVGEIWGYTVNDLFRSQKEVDEYTSRIDLKHLGKNWRPGDVRYEDTDGNKAVNNGKNTITDHGDMKVIGNDQPRFQYGINAGVSYKGIDFSMLWRGVGKKDIYFSRMSNIYWGFTNGWWESCLTPEHLDYYRDAPGTKYSGLYEGDANINTTAYWPRPYLNSTEEAKNKNNPNTRYLQSAAYLRLQNIQLGYTLPRHLTKKAYLEKVRIYFSGENLLTFSGLPNGIDPVAPVGFGEGGASDYYTGLTGAVGAGRLTYGADRIYSFGVTITY